MKIGKRITAALLCAIMLLSSVSAVDFSLNSNNNEKPAPSEATQTQIAEDVAQDANDVATSGIPDAEALENSAESRDGISTYDVRNPPLTEYDLVKCSGYVKTKDNPMAQVTETFGAQGGDGHASFTTKYKYVPGSELTFTFYKYGNGTYGFDQSDDYTNGGSGAPYGFVYNSYGDAVGYKVDEIITVTDTSLSEITLVSTARSRVIPLNTFVREVTVKFDDDRMDAPTTPHFVPDSNNPEKYYLTGVDSSMEYRLSTGTTWTSCDSSNISFTTPTSDRVYQVRYKATESQAESKLLSITLSARPSAPSLSYNRSTEILSGLSGKMEIKFGNGSYTAVGSSTMDVANLIDNIRSGETLDVSVRVKATENVQVGSDKTFTIYPRGAKPTTVKLNPITISLSGYTTTMEYKGDTDTAWKSLSGTTLDLQSYAKDDRAVKVSVRMKATASASASRPVEFTIPQLTNRPNITINYSNETINLANTNYQYSTNTSSWKNLTVTNGSWDISTIITASAKTLYLRKAATSTTPISAYTIISLPARATAPSAPVFVYNDPSYPGKAVFNGLTTAMQFKKSTDTNWTDVTSPSGLTLNIPTAAITYYVRNKATAQAFPSANKTLTLLKPGSAPGCVYNNKTEMITGLSTSMEMKIGNGSYTPVSASSFEVSSLIDNTAAGSSTVINVRTKATATSPTSADRTFTLYPRSKTPSSVVFNATSISLSGYTTAMEYKLDTDTAWKALSGTSLNLQSYAKDDRAVKVSVRMKATASASASRPAEFTIPQLTNRPNVTINYSNETIDGLDDANYQYSTNTNFWTNINVANGSWDISTLVTTYTRTIYLRKAATATTPISAFATISLPAVASAPSTPIFVYNDPDHPGMAVLNGLDSSMQFKKSTDTNWTDATSVSSLALNIPTSTATYYVRNKAVGQAFPSVKKALTLLKPGSAPEFVYNNTTEMITGLSTRMEMKIGNGSYTPVSASSLEVSSLIDNTAAGSSTVINVRTKATATAPASADKILTLYPRSKTPSGVVFNTASMSLSGYTTAMEYKLDTISSWKALSGTSLNLQFYAKDDRAIKVYVRMKATASVSASRPVEFTIPQLTDRPNITINHSNETISLANTNYQYSTNTSSWNNFTVTNGSWDISTLITASARTLYLRKAATSTTPISAYTIISLPARATAPSAPVFVYNDPSYPGKVVFKGLTTAMQFKKSTDTNWTDVTSPSGLTLNIPTAAITYYVRNKAVGQVFPSANKTLTLLKPGSAPGCVYNNTTEMITSLSTRMEMKIGNGSYTPVSASSFDVSSLIDNTAAGSSTVINVRTKATATAPASADKILTLYPRSKTPSGVVFNTASISLSGYTTAMEYKLDTNTAWKALSGTSLNLQAYAKKDRAVKVYVRMKATASASASRPVEFTIPQLTARRNATINYSNETISLANANYQYSTNNSSWTDITVTNGAWDISTLITTSAKTLYLRQAATSTAPISASMEITLPARTAAPNTPVFVYNDFYYPNSVILNGVTSDMQYKKSTDTSWTDITENGVELDTTTTTTIYHVRTKATEQSWASANRSLTLQAKAAAPECIYDALTETVSGLNTSMEISFNGAPYETILSGTTYKLTYLIDEISADENLEVKIRIKATANAPASQDVIFIINSRPMLTDVLPEQPKLPEEPTDKPEQLPEEPTDKPEQLPEEPTDKPEQLPEEPTDKPEQLPEEPTDKPEQLPEEPTDKPEQLPEEPTDKPEQLPEEPTDQPDLPDSIIGTETC